jgi:hypothetical protein
MNEKENIAVLRPKVEIDGICDERFRQVRDAFAQNLNPDRTSARRSPS